MKFAKYHGLGNTYIVIEPPVSGEEIRREEIIRICDVHFGVGSDGILWGPLPSEEADFGLKIFNPDGSPAEKSGNGLRIFSRYLWDQGRVGAQPFSVLTPGGKVTAQVHEAGTRVTIEMGRVSFDSIKIPVAGPPREVLNEIMELDGQEIRFCAATIGNPHCVLLRDQVSAAEAQRWGPRIENDPRFPFRTNVQFLQVLDRENIRIEIWERGAGYTLASGSSSCAASAAAHRLGLVEPHLTVHMPGGELQIEIAPGYAMTMTGPVVPICEGILFN